MAAGQVTLIGREARYGASRPIRQPNCAAANS